MKILSKTQRQSLNLFPNYFYHTWYYHATDENTVDVDILFYIEFLEEPVD